MADLAFTLNTGQKIPAVGYGTWQAPPGVVAEGVYQALKAGYRLIDCAYCYGNEAEAGQGLARAIGEGLVRREDVFVVTKVWASYNTRVALGLEKSLASLGLDYVDLFLVHWPLLLNPAGNDDKFPKLPDGSRDIVREGYHHTDTWAQMEALVAADTTAAGGAGEAGRRARAIGVSNYSTRYLRELLEVAKVVPAVNQIENHPALPQNDIVRLCAEKGIHVMAYSPLGSTGGPLFKEEAVLKVAEKHKVEPANVLLSWHIPRKSTVLAKSVTPSRIVSNLNIIKLDEEDLKLLDGYAEGLEKSGKVQRFVYPPFGIDFGFPDKS